MQEACQRATTGRVEMWKGGGQQVAGGTVEMWNGVISTPTHLHDSTGQKHGSAPTHLDLYLLYMYGFSVFF